MKPAKISDVELAFPGNVQRLMPMDEPGFKDYREKYNHNEDSSWGFRLFADAFFSGVSDLKMVPKEGIDSKAAMRHIRSIMGSFEPKHEDKTAACAYLFEHWFESATWTKTPRKTTA